MKSFTLLMFLMACSPDYPHLESVPSVDLERYAGLWYEISHLPVSFQENCDCTTAEYSLTGKSYIGVVNRCFDHGKQKWRSVKGKAFVVKGSNNSRL